MAALYVTKAFLCLSLLLGLIGCCLGCQSSRNVYTYPRYYLDNAPSRNRRLIQVPTSTLAMRIFLTSGQQYKPNLDHRLTFQVALNYRLALTIRALDVKPGPSGTGHCDPDRLDIYNGFPGNLDYERITGPEGICGKSPYRTYYSSKGTQLTVHFISGPMPAGKGFELIVTPTKLTDLCYTTYGKYSCRNRNCIDYRLRCDTYDNCGDNSDETLCSALSPVGLTGILLGALVAILAPIIVILVCCYGACGCVAACCEACDRVARKRRQRQRRIGDQDEGDEESNDLAGRDNDNRVRNSMGELPPPYPGPPMEPPAYLNPLYDPRHPDEAPPPYPEPLSIDTSNVVPLAANNGTNNQPTLSVTTTISVSSVQRGGDVQNQNNSPPQATSTATLPNEAAPERVTSDAENTGDQANVSHNQVPNKSNSHNTSQSGLDSNVSDVQNTTPSSTAAAKRDTLLPATPSLPVMQSNTNDASSNEVNDIANIHTGTGQPVSTLNQQGTTAAHKDNNSSKTVS